MKINISDFVTNRDRSISGQVMEIVGNCAQIIDDASDLDYPDSILSFEINDLQLLKNS